LQGGENPIFTALDSEKLDGSDSTGSQVNMPLKTDVIVARNAIQSKGSSHGGSRETSCMLSEVFSDQNIDWKLDMEDIHSRSTFKTLEHIKQ
jgi:hypothetical protein